MKATFLAWITQRLHHTCRAWLGLLLCGALKLNAAVWIPEHWETVTGTGWIPSWVEGHWEPRWVEGYWDTQTIDGYWDDVWVDGHTEYEWVDGYWDVSWTEGYWEENWVDGYWEEVWNDGYWEEVWVEGYEDEEGNWVDGYSDWNWVDGYSDWNWVDGYSEWNWVDGQEEWNWVDGHWDEQWVDGYWDSQWVPPYEESVWVEGDWEYDWVDGYWTLVWGPWSIDIWIEGHWEGPWTWTSHEVLGDWYWFEWSPDASTVLEGTSFTQTRTGVRSRVTWETNEAGDVRNFVSGPEYTSDSQQATGTKPATWTPFDEPGAWYATSSWAPDPTTVTCGQTFTQTASASRDHRTGERNELGQERNLSGYTEGGGTLSQNAVGTNGCGGGGGGGGGGGIGGIHPPTNIAVKQVGSRHVRLAWNPPSSGTAVHHYEISNGGSRYAAAAAADNAFVWAGLNSTTSYTFRVRSVDAAGAASEWSAVPPVTTVAETTPSGASKWLPVPKFGGIVNGLWQWSDDGLPDEVIGVDRSRFTVRITSSSWNYPFNLYWNPIDLAWRSADQDADPNTPNPDPFTPDSNNPDSYTPRFTDWLGLDPFWDDWGDGGPTTIDFTAEFSFTADGRYEHGVFIQEDPVAADPRHWGVMIPAALFPSGVRTLYGNLNLDQMEHPTFFLVRYSKPFSAALITIGGTAVSAGISGGTNVGPLTIPGVGTINIGSGGGSITLENGTVISVGSNGAVTINGSPASTGTIPLGVAGATAEVSTAGVTVSVPPNGNIVGVSVEMKPDGSGSLTLSNGAGIHVDATGKLSVSLPPSTPQSIVQIVNIASDILQLGKGAVVSVKDVLGVLGQGIGAKVPFPASGVLQDIGVGKDGLFEVVIKTGTDSEFRFTVSTFRPKIAVDANRDGTIAFDSSDATSATMPYRFWLNDDDDGNALNNETEVEGSTSTDYSSRGEFGIASKRDLEDFARLWINSAGITDALKSGDLQIGLRWKPNTDAEPNVLTGAPAINLYRHYESDGGTKYLTENATAIQQTTPPYSTTLIDAGNKNVVSSINGVFIFKKEVFANLSSSQTKTFLLLEGAGVGKGQLQLLLLDKNGNQVGEGSGVWLDIRRINTMFERVKATTQYAVSSNGIDATMPLPHDYIDPAQVPQPTMGWTADDRGEAFVPDPGEDLQNKNYIVFVHGWRQAPGIPPAGVSSSLTYARTMFKRLWHAGYKGRFAAFRWPTFYSGPELDDQNFLNGILTYNDSEYRAWKAGQSLAQYANQLPSGYKRRIAAHSMGNVVTGSAFKNGMAVDSYALLNAAVPAIAYQATVQRRWPTFTGIYSGVTLHRDYNVPSPTPNAPNSGTPVDDSSASVRDLSYVNQLGAMNATNVINFYLESDFATSISWNANNMVSRPDAFALPADGSSGYKYIATLSDPNWRLRLKSFSGSERRVTDAHEVMSYDCKVPTFTSGADGSTRGSILRTVDMGVYGFDREHSAQWQWRFQQTAQFYHDLLVEFGLTPTL